MIWRIVELILATVFLIASAPILALAGITIWLEDGVPVFFKQRRVGTRDREFELLKLRTMRVNYIAVEDLGQIENDNPLLLRTGQYLRRLKIDELPQLYNVIRGDMSLVGPRPTIPEQVEKYSDFERRRLNVRPGMTGWAQVNGNAVLNWKERIALDVWYVENRSFRLDVRILFRTITVIVLGERPNQFALDQARDLCDQF